MQIIINLIIISIIISFIIDLSGIVENIKRFIWKLLYPKLAYKHLTIKPFDCSLCMNFWVSIIYIILINKFTLPYILLICILSFLETEITGVLNTIKYLINKLITWIQKKL